MSRPKGSKNKPKVPVQEAQGIIQESVPTKRRGRPAGSKNKAIDLAASLSPKQGGREPATLATWGPQSGERPPFTPGQHVILKEPDGSLHRMMFVDTQGSTYAMLYDARWTHYIRSLSRITAAADVAEGD